MSLALTLDAPYYGALDDDTIPNGTSAEVPGRFDVALAGHPYMIDLQADLQGFRGEHFSRSSVPVLRAQADTSNVPAEQSINRDSLWRRSQETWHHGSGQDYYDRSDSDSARFHTSKGVNVWDKWTLSLLPDSHLIRASGNTNVRLTNAGTHTYLSDGNDLLFTTNPTAGSPTFTTVTGTPASSCLWLTTDGYTVYAAYATALWATTRGAAAATSYATGFASNISVVGYVKGRLMVAAGRSLFNVIATGAAPTALFDHPNTDFNWVGFTEGPGFIYAAGYSGTRSLIYKTGIQPDGTALDSPVVAGELPTGETVRSIKGYLGLLIVGTDLGFRVASIDSSGYLTFGSLVPTDEPVLNFEPADRFVWYGLSNYDSASTGLGRMDLSTFTQPLTPARASDLMHIGQGQVTSISTADGMRLFAVAGAGFFAESSTLVASGTITSGRITYGVGDDKIAMFLDLRHQPLAGTVEAYLRANDTVNISLGASIDPGSVSSQYGLNAQQTRAEFFELTLTLNQGSTTTGPTVTRTTLRAYPAPARTLKYTVPILLNNTILDQQMNPLDLDIAAERLFLENLVLTQRLVTYQEGSMSSVVVVEDFDWIPDKRTFAHDKSTYQGTFVVTLKEQAS